MHECLSNIPNVLTVNYLKCSKLEMFIQLPVYSVHYEKTVKSRKSLLLKSSNKHHFSNGSLVKMVNRLIS